MKLHCKKGHKLDEVYAYINKDGKKIVECKQCVSEKNDRRAEQIWQNHIKRTYNLTPEQYNSMLKKQDYKCAVCGSTDPGNGRNKNRVHFCIDHSHYTGEIRKLLCVSCNSCLGNVKDNPELLRKLALYLEKFQSEGLCGSEPVLGVEESYVSVN